MPSSIPFASEVEANSVLTGHYWRIGRRSSVSAGKLAAAGHMVNAALRPSACRRLRCDVALFPALDEKSNGIEETVHLARHHFISAFVRL
ncbi:hypothetical protein [Ensifer sp.]|uniref:hypothetical protein n=1 Tax=Ensifer sp. TaxID=1872086 RepID=UPI0028995AF9|nr:hypothetical protein [Ensifer sp.]